MTTYNVYGYRVFVDFDDADIIRIIPVLAMSESEAVKKVWNDSSYEALRPFDCRAANEPIPPRMALVVLS